MGLRQARWVDFIKPAAPLKDYRFPLLVELDGTEKELSLDEKWLASNPCAWQRTKHHICGKPAAGCHRDEQGLRWYCSSHMETIRKMVTALKRVLR
jgi:hypothetical protein